MGSFKAIVVGGGPVGMTMAHALSLAKIDFVVVEKRDSISTFTGAGLFLWAQALRIYHQMGLLEALLSIGSELQTRLVVLPGGKVFRRKPEGSKTNLGYPMMGYERGEFLQLLYNKLPDAESRIKTKKALSKIETTENGVIARFEDGSYEEGSIVIAVDGVWSATRRILGSIAPPGAVDTSPWKAKYAASYGRARAVTTIPDHSFIDRYAKGFCIQMMNHGDQTFWFVSKPISETQDKIKYTDSEEENFLQDVLQEKVYENVTFKEIWNNRIVSGLTKLDSGVAEAWYWDRVVMIGDAVHKPTPNVGAGVVCGVDSVVILANKLHALLQTHPDPTTGQLVEAFAAYQAKRNTGAQFLVKIGHMLMEKQMWATWYAWFSTLFIDPLIDRFVNRKIILPRMALKPKLDFVPFENQRMGLYPWRDPDEVESEPAKSWYGMARGIIRWALGYKVPAKMD